MNMKYGYFDNYNKTYVITNPKTPVTWINYIGTLEFGGFVDQTGGALICKGDPALNRIVKYLPQLPNSDFKGETLYIRLKDKSQTKVFSPFYVPTLDNYDWYQCHVGLGYMKYISVFHGIQTEVTVFVPLKDHRVIRDIRVKNLNHGPVEIDLIPVVEYTHFDALKQFTNGDWVPQTMQSKAIYEEGHPITLIQYAYMNKESQLNFFTSNVPISSFETDRKRFLGDEGYGTWKNPQSLIHEELSNYEALRGDNIGALMCHLGTIQGNETKRMILQLGQCGHMEEEKPSIHYYRQEDNVDKALKELKMYWENYLSNITIKTPNENMNTMLNIHNPRQCWVTKYWSRYLSLYQLGFGFRGIGVRDSAQDILGVMSHMPEEGRILLEKLLSVQKTDGSAMHQFNPITMEATEGDAREALERPKFYSDDHLWVIIAVCAYLKETENMNFLTKEIPYYEKDRFNKPIESGTVFDHLIRGIGFTKQHVGQHGLPLLGFADWNDTVNLEDGAESMFTSNLYGFVLKEIIELLNILGKTEDASKYKKDYDETKKKFNEFCWDGEWFIRYFDSKGNPLGSKENSQGQIYANAQSWSVISGFATDNKGEKALDSVYRILNTKKGIKLSYPGFDQYHKEKGGITTYPPGAKENGGIFLHSNPWVIMAEAMMGNGSRVLEYYNQINPVSKNDSIHEYECEPYCYAQNILGDEHPQFGLGRNAWLSGTASWMYQVGIQYILGIQPHYKGLIVDPCIPEEWEGFSITRMFRNAIYEIKVKNSNKVSKGVKEIIVDGIKGTSQIIPTFQDGCTHQVLVIMG
jgi:cellobiose phosphorylase